MATPSADSQISKGSAVQYWSGIPATVDGMLGGYSQISKVDLRGSRAFISKLRRSATSTEAASSPLLSRAADCGAGIGRITAGLLSHVCEVVDVVEPVAKLAQQIEHLPSEYLGAGAVGTVYVCGLESWHPTDVYDLIWNQWCLGHLNDASLEAYLRRCQRALRPGGWIVAKENISATEDLYDDVDSSVTRTDDSYRSAFTRAGLKVVRSELQKGLPPALGLYRIRLYALQPETT